MQTISLLFFFFLSVFTSPKDFPVMERDLSAKNILRVFFFPSSVYSNFENWAYASQEFYMLAPKSSLFGSVCVSADGNKERGAVDMGLLLFMCVRLPLHPATPHWKTYSMAVRAIPLSVCRHGPPDSYQTGFKQCSDAQRFIQLTVVDDINAKSGWSLKTEKIHLNWHVYIDTTHIIRHLFLTWTSLYPFTFLKT